MFRIAVCDDNEQDLEILLEKAGCWLKEKEIKDGRLEVFHNASGLRKALEEGLRYELFILDILMPEMNGIELGRLIRQTDAKVPVIYTSSSPEFALDAYGVYAVRYLNKPLDDKELWAALDFAHMLHCFSGSGEEKHRMVINGRTTVSSIFIEDVMYIENSLRCITYTLRGGENVISLRRGGSFEEAIAPVMENSDFIQTHKSFVVNMNYIRLLQANVIVMEDEKSIPIARKRLNDVREIYIRFISEGKGGAV